MYKFILTILLFCSVVISGCASGTAFTEKIGSGTLTVPECTITAPADGKLQGLILEENELISKNQPLFAVTNDTTTEQLAAAAAKLAKAKAELKEMETPSKTSGISNNLPAAQAAYEAARQNAAKMDYLLSQGAVSQRQAKAAQDALSAAAAALSSASQHNVLFKTATPESIANQKALIQKLQQEEAQLKMLQSQNEAMSPFAGIIMKKYAENNTMVTKGQEILYIKATDSCFVTIKAGKELLSSLKTGQKVSIEAGSLPAFEGYIKDISADTVTVASDNKPAELTGDTHATVNLIK